MQCSPVHDFHLFASLGLELDLPNQLMPVITITGAAATAAISSNAVAVAAVDEHKQRQPMRCAA